MRLSKTIALTVGALIFFARASAAQHPSHPLIGPYEGSQEARYFVAQFDEFPLVVGPFAQNKFSKVEPIKGKITHFQYRDPADRSTLEVITNYTNALKKSGFQILFSCSGAECGTANTMEMDRWLGEWCANTKDMANCAKEPMRYVAAKLTRQSGDVYVAIKDMHPQYDSERSGTYLNVIEMKPMDTDKVPSAAEMSTHISATGHETVYGIHFDTGKSDIKPESSATLVQIAKLLSANPSMKLYVVGHTDNAGTYAANVALSKQRADAVVAALVGTYHIAAARLQAGGVGPMAPVASNKSEAGRAQNRRVELVEQ